MFFSQVQTLKDYLTFLKNQYGLSLSIHDQTGAFGPLLKEIAPFCIHDHPYCMAVKSSDFLWRRCVSCQTKVQKKCASGSFFGTCYAGVSEFVLPVTGKDQVVAFLSVSGYRRPPRRESRLTRLAKRYNIEPGLLRDAYFSLNPEIPSMEEILQKCGIVSSYLSLLYLQLSEKKEVRPEPDLVNPYLYSHILYYLSKHYTEPVRLSHISRFCHCSESAISHLFKTRSGRSVNQYVNDLRVEKAKLLLTETQLSVTEISDRLGFQDSNYFSTVFRRLTGKSPRDFRNAPG